MKATIKSISLENFKGVKSATYQLDGKNVSAIGQNGAGKTTLFTAYMWMMADKDSDLKSNPNIRPLDTEECMPRVEVVFDIDGKEVTAAKIQNRTVIEVEENGQKKTKIALDNSYEVNSIPMGLKAFTEKMQTYGFDFKKFLPLSHPDAFTANMSAKKEKEAMRNTLFEMTNSYTDLEIAEMLGNIPETAELLKDYSMEEIRAKQNSIKREIAEHYGDKGEILRAEIRGKESSKTDIDVAELELLKNSLNEQIAENKAKQEDISKEFEEQQKASDGILELKFELNDLQRKANEENNSKRREIEDKISDKKFLISKTERTIKETENDIANTQEKNKRLSEKLEELREQYKTTQERVFDENSLICSFCGQELPTERKEQSRAEFENHKQAELSVITKRGNIANADLKTEKETLRTLDIELSEHKKSLEMLNNAIADLEQQLSELPDSIDISDRPEAQEIQRKIAEKEQAMNKGNSAEEMRQKLKGEEYYFQSQLTEVEKQIALAQKNVEIDEQIADLRKKQGEFEQNKANCERILDQLDMVSKRKNELLTDEVNSHFKLVKFRLFDYLKNGSVVDDCEPTIDGKSLKDHSNGALRVLAKLDIVDGLQRFYGQHYPVFADDFSLVTDNTECRIDMDCQLIKLVAEKGVKELKIEMEG